MENEQKFLYPIWLSNCTISKFCRLCYIAILLNNLTVPCYPSYLALSARNFKILPIPHLEMFWAGNLIYFFFWREAETMCKL